MCSRSTRATPIRPGGIRLCPNLGRVFIVLRCCSVKYCTSAHRREQSNGPLAAARACTDAHPIFSLARSDRSSFFPPACPPVLPPALSLNFSPSLARFLPPRARDHPRLYLYAAKLNGQLRPYPIQLVVFRPAPLFLYLRGCGSPRSTSVFCISQLVYCFGLIIVKFAGPVE